MRVEVRIDCSPDEVRRLLGQPALLPLYEALALAWERGVMGLVIRSVDGAPAAAPAPPPGGARQTRSA